VSAASSEDPRKADSVRMLIKRILDSIAGALVRASDRNRMMRYLYGQIISRAMNSTQRVEHAGIAMTFSVPNAQCRFRAQTFSTKEPETLEWIAGIPRDATLWDVGANVGLYTCYAAKARGCRVFAFEPSVFNLEILARNIFLNDLTQQVVIVPLPLSDRLQISTLNMTTMDWGGALSTFGETYGHEGTPLRKLFEFPTIGLSVADAIGRLEIPPPDYMKMDVDGIEHLILQGGAAVLAGIKGALIEVNDHFTSQADGVSEIMRGAGLSLKSKRHAEYFDSSKGAERHTFNQIWAP
jgi:FkbM family methyltransferase